MPDPQIDATAPTTSRISILFVCTGNICRSPLAEVMARKMFEDASIVFSSAGTHAIPGDQATEHAQTVARGRSLDLSGHRAKRLDQCDPPDVVIGMTARHLVAAAETYPGLDRHSIRLLDAHDAVADPYGRDLDTYEAAAMQIERALALVPEIERDAIRNRGHKP